MTKAQVAAAARWLTNYRDGMQNGKPYRVNSVWSKGTGGGQPGLSTCVAAGYVVSVPDDALRSGGWRHDITDAGRAALEQGS